MGSTQVLACNGATYSPAGIWVPTCVQRSKWRVTTCSPATLQAVVRTAFTTSKACRCTSRVASEISPAQPLVRRIRGKPGVLIEPRYLAHHVVPEMNAVALFHGHRAPALSISEEHTPLRAP